MAGFFAAAGFIGRAVAACGGGPADSHKGLRDIGVPGVKLQTAVADNVVGLEYIPRGQFGIVGENGPEIVNGPANVTSRRNTAALAAVVAGMMGVAAAPAELPPLHPLALPAKGGEAMVSRAATVPPIYRIEAPTQIIIQTQPGQSAQDIAREVARQLDERERRLKAKARSNYSDQGGYDA